MKKVCLTLLLATALYAPLAYGQGSETYGSGLKINLNPEGNRYIRFIIWNQIWTRWNQNNPGTLINNEATDKSFDIGARRLRILAYAQITPRYLILTHIGINNQTFVTGGAAGSAAANSTGTTGANGPGKKPQLFFHDVWNEYALFPAKDPVSGEAKKHTLYLGAGLHYWWGLSRMSSASTLNFLTIDAPIFNWPLVEASDQFVRQFGFYGKGRLGKIGYSFHYNMPFATNNVPPLYTDNQKSVAVDNNGAPRAAIGAYADYQFFDQEANVLPFRVGTYIGTKKVFNIGAGFYHNAQGTRSYNANGQLQKHDIKLWAVDTFLDLPVGSKEKNMAVTFYGVYYNYDFGPNYLRNIGIMNLGTVNSATPALERALSGPGNARPTMGTGNILYGQLGFLLPKGKQGISTKGRLQPFFAYARKDFQALPEAGNYLDAGMNLFLDGHHAKITGQYSTRPVYINNALSKSLAEILLQVQVYL